MYSAGLGRSIVRSSYAHFQQQTPCDTSPCGERSSEPQAPPRENTLRSEGTRGLHAVHEMAVLVRLLNIRPDSIHESASLDMLRILLV